MKRHLLAMMLALSGFSVGVSIPQPSSPNSDALFDIFAKKDGHWNHFGPVWNGSHMGFSHVTLALETLTAEGWEIVAVTSRNGANYNAAPVVAVTPQGTSLGFNCPGYPNPPFANAQCYADGGWR